MYDLTMNNGTTLHGLQWCSVVACIHANYEATMNRQFTKIRKFIDNNPSGKWVYGNSPKITVTPSC